MLSRVTENILVKKLYLFKEGVVFSTCHLQNMGLGVVNMQRNRKKKVLLQVAKSSRNILCNISYNRQ